MSADTTPRWEYRVVKPPREPTKKEVRDPTRLLDEVAAEGWELDETLDYVGGGTKFLVLRRPASATGGESGSDEDRSEMNAEADDE
ncbi:hypothetical protein M0R88_14510 [Halorussus gelatinilyticus]|uniref:DUF4177 domain-containing protein n=1 Tax=Halorussus gelatinilyticus TaxID=2937524 RepID=A0A8U0IF72_9EURY|nr:hypothetical protein [Halorussus gelatinilyticus]UPV99719.1 hypothetical protein M0R88_14510 [Halorussus gelatinilyticus]